MNVGYARCSTVYQDVLVQRQQLEALGIDPGRIYVDEAKTGRNRERPGLSQALAALREGDRLTVTKLDRFARSVQDARDLLDELSRRGVQFAMGSSIYDWSDPFARMFLQILATVAEFEVDLLRQRTREGLEVARAAGKLKGKKPKLNPAQRRELFRMLDSGDYTIAETARVLGVSRPTVYREMAKRAPEPPAIPEPPPPAPAPEPRSRAAALMLGQARPGA